MNMIIENQLIEIIWNVSNKKHFESKGYIYTGINNKFLVKPEDLCLTSKVKVKVSCDFCGKIFFKKYCDILKCINAPLTSQKKYLVKNVAQ